MISISFSDVLRIPEFIGMGEMDLIPVEMDAKVLPYLYVMGLNIYTGYEVVVSKHRNLFNEMVTGYRYSGEIRLDKAFQKTVFCTPVDRIVAASQSDLSLARELSMMSGSSYSSYDSGDGETDPNDYLELGNYENDYEEVSDYLKVLAQVCRDERGSPNGISGALKTHEEYISK
jgi:hypothetical protein